PPPLRLGAEQIIMLGRHPDRIALARMFGATDIVRERGDAAIERVRELTGGLGAPSALEILVRARHPERIALARMFGATDIVRERGDAAIERVRELTGGLGAHSVLE